MATHKIVAQDTPARKKAKEAPTEKNTSSKASGASNAPKASAVAKEPTPPKEKKAKRNPFKAFIGYFVGAWHELKEVRWPNRQATWSFTLAVIVFVVLFTAIIAGLDALFKWLFQIILK